MAGVSMFPDGRAAKLYMMETKPRSYAERLDAAVEEVFQTMLGVSCRRVEAAGCTLRQESYGAVVGFAGAMRGSCVVKVDQASGLLLAELLTGLEQTDEALIQDGLGEVCNMVAGTWKGGIPRLASDCMLSPPTVIAGYDFRLHSQPSPLQIRSCYRFGAADLEVGLQGDLVE